MFMRYIDLGSAYGTAKSGVGLAHLGVMDASKIMKGIVPSVMAGILGIYGLIVALIIVFKIDVANGYSSFSGYSHLAAGLGCGFSALSAGMCIGVTGDAGVRAFGKQNRIFVALILILIFAEALGLYGLIVALVATNAPGAPESKLEKTCT